MSTTFRSSPPSRHRGTRICRRSSTEGRRPANGRRSRAARRRFSESTPTSPRSGRGRAAVVNLRDVARPMMATSGRGDERTRQRFSENTQPSSRRTPICLALQSLRDSWGMLGGTSGRVRIAVFQTSDADSLRCHGLPQDACDSVRRAGRLCGSSVNHATTLFGSVWLRGCVVRSQGACLRSRGSYGNSRFLFSLL